jgi:hypothetical protein
VRLAATINSICKHHWRLILPPYALSNRAAALSTSTGSIR